MIGIIQNSEITALIEKFNKRGITDPDLIRRLMLGEVRSKIDTYFRVLLGTKNFNKMVRKGDEWVREQTYDAWVNE
jgi:hypothetical protein